MLRRFEKKNKTSQGLREYVKNYLIRYINYITMYLKSSKYPTKLKSLINIMITAVYPKHLWSAYVYIYTRGPCDRLYVDVFVHRVSQGITCTCIFTLYISIDYRDSFICT